MLESCEDRTGREKRCTHSVPRSAVSVPPTDRETSNRAKLIMLWPCTATTVVHNRCRQEVHIVGHCLDKIFRTGIAHEGDVMAGLFAPHGDDLRHDAGEVGMHDPR